MYPFLIWGIFILGTGELALVFFRPLYFILTAGLQAIILVSYVMFLLPGKNHVSKIVKATTTCIILTSSLKVAFLNGVWLELPYEIIFLNLISLVTFIISAIAITPLLLKFSNGAN